MTRLLPRQSTQSGVAEASTGSRRRPPGQTVCVFSGRNAGKHIAMTEFWPHHAKKIFSRTRCRANRRRSPAAVDRIVSRAHRHKSPARMLEARSYGPQAVDRASLGIRRVVELFPATSFRVTSATRRDRSDHLMTKPLLNFIGSPAHGEDGAGTSARCDNKRAYAEFRDIRLHAPMLPRATTTAISSSSWSLPTRQIDRPFLVSGSSSDTKPNQTLTPTKERRLASS